MAAFIVARIFLLWDTARPTHVGAGSGDIARYSGWAQQIVQLGQAPYSQVGLEYPPGIIPAVVAAEVMPFGGDEYRERFVALMLMIDAAGFAGLMVMARRTGSVAGPWLWIVALILVGPIAYLRLDLIPAVATIWALERASAGAWGVSGGLWGFAILAKLYPILLLPSVVLASRRKKELLLGAGITSALMLMGFTGWLDDMWRSVLGYHGDRGLQLESTWAVLLLTAARRGYQISVEYSFGAYHVSSAISGPLKNVATIASVGAAGVGTWVITRFARDDLGRITLGLYGLLAILLGLGTVLSPQFLVWLIALAACAACFELGSVRILVFAIAPIAGLTQIIFPYWYNEVVTTTGRGVIVLGLRNLLLIAVGALVMLELLQSDAEQA